MLLPAVDKVQIIITYTQDKSQMIFGCKNSHQFSVSGQQEKP